MRPDFQVLLVGLFDRHIGRGHGTVLVRFRSLLRIRRRLEHVLGCDVPLFQNRLDHGQGLL